MKILLVEDNLSNLELFRDLLEFKGHEVIEAKTGKEVISIAKEKAQEIDLILMDIQLPELDGLAATKILREDEKTAEIPVIALTAHAMNGDKENILEAGCNGYISKPIDTRTFVSEIENICISLNRPS